MRPGARAENARRAIHRFDGATIGQDDDRALDIEKTDDVVAVGAKGAAMRDVAPTRKYARVPAEAIAKGCAVVGRAGGEGPLQRRLRNEAFGIQSLIPEKQIIECGEKTAVADGQQRVIPARELTVFLEIALRQLVAGGTGAV